MRPFTLHIHARRLLSAILRWGMLLVAVFLVLAGLLVYFGTPELARFRPEMEAAMADALKQPVHIDRMHVFWDDGLRITLQDVRVGSPQAPQILLPHLDIAFHPLPLLWGRYAVRSLSLDRPYLAMARLSDGRLKIGGKVLGGKGDSLSITLEHANIRIQNGILDWRDARHPHIGLLRLQQVNLRVTSGYRQHLEGSVALPPTLGESIQASGAARHLFSDPANSWGDVKVSVRHLHTDLLAGYFTEALPFSVGGTVSGTLLGAWHKGKVTHLRGPIQVSQPSLTYPAYYTNPLRARALELDLDWKIRDKQGRLLLRNIRLKRAGELWRPFNVTLHSSLTNGPTRIALHVDRMRINPTLKLLPPKLIPLVWQRYFAQAKPQGNVEDFRLAWQEGTPRQAEHFAISNRFSQVSTQAVDKAPGLSNLHGALKLIDQRGTLSLAGNHVVLDWPYAFRQKIPMRTFNGQANWQWNNQHLAVNISHFKLSGDVNAEGNARILHRPGQRIYLDIAAKAAKIQARYLPRYYPYRIMDKALLHWLDNAILQGVVDNAALRLRGNVDKFPFANPRDGIFTARAQVKDVKLRYDPKWPVAERINGNITFLRQGMRIQATHGRILDAPIRRLSAAIPDLMHHKPFLHVSGAADPSVNTVLRFLRASPLLRDTELGRANIQATGMGPLRIKLDLPLWEHGVALVKGDMALKQAGLTWDEWAARDISGTLHFTENTLRASGLQADFLDGPAQIAVQVDDMKHAPLIQVQAQGRASPAALNQRLQQSWLTRIHGPIPYTLQTQIQGKQGHYQFQSPLTGVSVDLPQPLHKAADAPRTLEAQGDFVLNQDLRIATTLDHAQAAQLLLKKGDNNWTLAQAAWRLDGTEIPPLPARGWRLLGQGDTLPLEEWIAYFSAPTPTGQIPPGPTPTAPATPLPPISVDTRWRHVTFLGRDWPDLRIQGDMGEALGKGQLALQGPNATGTVQFAQDSQHGIEARIRLDQLHMPPAPPPQPGTGIPSETPSVPAGDASPIRLDVTINDLQWDRNQLDHLAVIAQRQPNSWRIVNLLARKQDTVIQAEGSWSGPGQGQTRLHGRFSAPDLAALLRRFSFDSGLKGGHADASGELIWPGWPLAFDVGHLSGDIAFDLKDGRFTEVSPVVKILSLANVTSMLQRLLTFDFRDFQGKGLFVRSMHGNLELKDGIANVKTLELNSSAMHILAQGDINLRRRNMDLDLDIQPLQAVDLLIGRFPVLGPMLFGKEGAVIRLRYKAIGPWQDPSITPVFRFKGEENHEPNRRNSNGVQP